MMPCPEITCIPAANSVDRQDNISHAFKLGLKRLPLNLEANDHKLSIVGGGPSLNETYRDISGVVLSCGSSHDHLTMLGVKSHFHIECDPSLSQVRFYQSEKKDCKYLIASRCHASMFQRLKGRQKLIWHMWEDDLPIEVYRGEPAVRGAISCTICAIPIAMSMGFRDVHFFGFDSSFTSGTRHHAYDCEENAGITPIQLGDGGPTFLTTPTWIAQGRTFYQMQKQWWDIGFRATVHGDSMMREQQKQSGLGYV